MDKHTQEFDRIKTGTALNYFFAFSFKIQSFWQKINMVRLSKSFLW
jgi:hypothetical protein